MNALDDEDTLRAAHRRALMGGYYSAAFRALRMARLYEGTSDSRTRECLHVVRRYRGIISMLRRES